MQATDLFGRRSRQERELAGLDNLELPLRARKSGFRRFWSGAWPQLAAIGIALTVWQVVVFLELKPVWVLPGPLAVLPELWHDLTRDTRLFEAMATTIRRAAFGFALALVIGSLIGLAVTRFKLLRTAVASLITGLQTMPSIAWFPLAILLFGLTEQAMMFVVILGAAPSVANGLIHGIDHIPRILLRAGRVLGARRLDKYRFVIFPAALPSFIGGLKQAWAFAWRSLMAGELLVIIASQPALGVRLQLQREQSDAVALIGTMLVILAVGIIVDLAIFGTIERRIRRRRGLGVA
jgi:NitT/TauT family transport system permease protein